MGRPTTSRPPLRYDLLCPKLYMGQEYFVCTNVLLLYIPGMDVDVSIPVLPYYNRKQLVKVVVVFTTGIYYCYYYNYCWKYLQQ